MIYTVFSAYCLYHRTKTEDLRFSLLRDLKYRNVQKRFGYIRKVLATAKLLLQNNYDEKLIIEIGDCKMLFRMRIEVYLELDLIYYSLLMNTEMMNSRIYVLLQIHLTVAVSIANCERSFIKLKLIV